MLKILIADDDKNEREGIQFLIRKLNLPLEMSFARNGRAALQMMKEEIFDLLLTDIKMPFMDGLELAKEARIVQPRLKIVILSGHGEFAYAKQAIALHVSEYLLKPIEAEEFALTLNKVIALCEKEREQEQRMELLSRERLLFRLIQGTDAEMLEENELSVLELEGYWVQMQLVEFRERFFHRHYLSFIQWVEKIIPVPYDCLQLNERQCVFFLRLNTPEVYEFNLSLWEQLQAAVSSEHAESTFCVVFGKPLKEARALRSEYEKMEQHMDMSFYASGSAVFFTDRIQTSIGQGEAYELVEPVTREINKFIAKCDLEQAAQAIVRLEQTLIQTGSLSLLYVKHLYTEIVKSIYSSHYPTKHKEAAAAMESIMRAKQLHQLRQTVLTAIEEVRQNQESSSSEMQARAVEEVLQIIEQEYAQDLSLEYLARRVHLSGSYLSQLFKKKTGTSVIKFINQYRMEKAKEYLSQENYKIVEVYGMVGFSDASYFGLAFKNYFGLTPSQYRAKVRSS